MSGVTAGTYNTVTVNSLGHVTARSNVSFAKVATSGSYNYLTNLPTIPSAYTHPTSRVSPGTYNSVTVNAQGHVTAGTSTKFSTVATSGSYNDLTNKPSIPTSSGSTWSQKSSKSSAGNWTITGCTSGKPLFIIACSKTFSWNYIWIVPVSGIKNCDQNWGTAGANAQYLLGGVQSNCSGNCLTVIPSSSTVTVRIQVINGSMTVYAYN